MKFHVLVVMLVFTVGCYGPYCNCGMDLERNGARYIDVKVSPSEIEIEYCDFTGNDEPSYCTETSTKSKITY